MTKLVRSDATSRLNGDFLAEYNSEKSIRKYTKQTAGNGISYLLNHDYAKIYLDVIEGCIPKARLSKGIRMWEFGCGGGMNLLHLISLLERMGIPLECAYGTDFSEALIEAANSEARRYLTPAQRLKVRFCVARNETLIEDVTRGLGTSGDTLLGSFDIIFGVNTIRYCHRLMTEDKCVGAVHNLLTDSGVCIVIDMNRNFPVFRSRFRDRLTKDETAYYLPSLDEYARPFSSRGFEILKKNNFCWIPHSAGSGLTVAMRALTPLLNAIVPNYAMRSLVIARKIDRRCP